MLASRGLVPRGCPDGVCKGSPFSLAHMRLLYLDE
jgi:hypothetical protein